MSISLITGLGALIFGVGYNKAYKSYSQYKVNLNVIGMSPRDTRPCPKTYFTVRDVKLMEQAEHEWNKYNEIRKYYYSLMEERAKEIKGRNNWSYDRHSEFWITEWELLESKSRNNRYEISRHSEPYENLAEQCSDIVIKSNAYNSLSSCDISVECLEKYGRHIYLDRRFTDIYKEMLEQGVTLEFRPGIDRLGENYWEKGIEGYYGSSFPQDIEMISEGKDPNQICGFKYIFTKYGLEHVHMDYKRFYKPEYLGQGLSFNK